MYLLAIMMVAAGANHFAKAEFYLRMVPPQLPFPDLIVKVSGVFEILGGIGLLLPQTRVAAAWGLVALFIAVFPANIYMAVTGTPYTPGQSPLIAWIRLPFQGVFIAWAWWFTR
ncbi:MAG: DoxX family protein [Bdellovibrionota bacterium]